MNLHYSFYVHVALHILEFKINAFTLNIRVFDVVTVPCVNALIFPIPTGIACDQLN